MNPCRFLCVFILLSFCVQGQCADASAPKKEEVKPAEAGKGQVGDPALAPEEKSSDNTEPKTSPDAELPDVLILAKPHNYAYPMVQDELKYLKAKGYALAVETLDPEFWQQLYDSNQLDHPTFRQGEGMQSFFKEARDIGMPVKFVDVSKERFKTLGGNLDLTSSDPCRYGAIAERNLDMADQLEPFVKEYGRVAFIPGSNHAEGLESGGHPCGNSISSVLRDRGYKTVSIGISPPDDFEKIYGKKFPNYVPADYSTNQKPGTDGLGITREIIMTRGEFQAALNQAVPGIAALRKPPVNAGQEPPCVLQETYDPDKALIAIQKIPGAYDRIEAKNAYTYGDMKNFSRILHEHGLLECK